MAQQILGGLTVLNTATNLDPMFTELYAAAGGNFTAVNTINVGSGSGIRSFSANGGTGAAEGAAFIGRRGGSNSFILGDAGSILGAGGGDTLLYTYGANNQRFYTNGLERMRIDSAGNVGIGTIPAANKKFHVKGGNLGNFFLDNDGSQYTEQTIANNGVAKAQLIYDNSSMALSLYNFTAGVLVLGTNSQIRMSIGATGNISPGADNTQSMGTGSARWSTVYAGTGAINTSDAREKTKVKQLTDDELAAAKQIAREFGTYQFLSAVEEKSEAARLHAGTTVQRVIEIMDSHGLDPMRYAFICYDEWEAERDEEGNETRPAGNRYGFRTDELLMFIARGVAARLDDLESRLSDQA